jgi:hypothetical protein
VEGRSDCGAGDLRDLGRAIGTVPTTAADGSERILGRWSSYAQDGHGGNVALRELDVKDPSHKQDFVFSILRVFDPSAATAELNAAESHSKEALAGSSG